MASITITALSKGAPEDSVSVTDPRPVQSLKNGHPESPLSAPELTLVKSSTIETSEDTILPTDVSLITPSVDAADVPLPDDEDNHDDLKTSSPDNDKVTDQESNAVELSNTEPTDVDTTNSVQDDIKADDANEVDTSLAPSSSAPSSPRTPRSKAERSSDSEDRHDTPVTPLSSIDSSPKTSAKENPSSDPFVTEDPATVLSLDSVDWSSLDTITSFIEKLENLQPDEEDSLDSNTIKAFEAGKEYDGPIIAIPDTPEYHPYSENFQVCISKYGGFGTFATRDLKLGEVILVEKPLLRTSRVDFHTNFLKLSKKAQEAIMQLYTPPGNYRALDGTDPDHIWAIVAANSFALMPYDSGIVAVHNVTSRLNHACQPVANVKFDHDAKNMDAIILTMTKPVKAGSELFISYGGPPLSLYERYGFRCCCGGCKGVSDQDISIMQKRKRENFWMTR
ncbi:hypothetical protein B0T20DRAFT_456903 [Sordaria brevicollis]|uniref:SET domain-containing protein n=1 Tax=Sordaria brevicollis TaxID=83679 RepID=A0AAE0NW84_SORBR|nr:hypothetical protein B0T20DRAFT_456903 [Sordaria brevicollis]